MPANFLRDIVTSLLDTGIFCHSYPLSCQPCSTCYSLRDIFDLRWLVLVTLLYPFKTVAVHSFSVSLQLEIGRGSLTNEHQNLKSTIFNYDILL
ncbi:hypothetical protein OUZ56_020621 [Daphnia magna]|uniref:Uncharacterized protein n=1 Tax=Daphnia magna TaxID=35525 RepID=A0ABQ9ZEZ7_9CRUS|nr:hypothetical protein OUZ56_020621 [Daphnia magna]